MSKKLIAIASAVALSFTGLVMAPAANAVNDWVTVDDTYTYGSGADGSEEDPFVMHVPFRNEFFFDGADDEEFSNVVQVNVYNGGATEKTVSISASNVFLLKAPYDIDTDNMLIANNDGDPVTVADGKSALSITLDTGEDKDFYVFTKSTTIGSVTIKKGTDTQTLSFKGIAGAPNSFEVTAPKSIGVSGTAKVYAVVSDVFGNKIADQNYGYFDGDDPSDYETSIFDADDVLDESLVGGTGSSLGDFTYSKTAKAWKATLTGRDSEGPLALALDWESVAADQNAYADGGFEGLDAPGDAFFATLNNVDLQDQVDALQTLNDKYAAKFNKLAKKWNKKFPGKKVALIK